MSEYRLDELCEILDSKRVPLSAMQRAKRHGPYPYYGAQSVIDHVDDYLLDGEYLLVAEDGANLVTRTQDIANLVNGKIWVNNHAHILGYNGKCPLRLLGFLLNHSNISPYVTGCAQPKLNQDNLRRIKISLPEKVDEVSSILSSLDSKIENNHKICANLEAQAQALFKHWFIDFAPFKDGKFVESELGMIPEGWKVGKLGEIADITMGQSPSGSSYNEEGNGSIFYQGRSEFGFRFPSIRLFTTEPKKYAEPLSTLLSVRAPVGDINVATVECCIGRGLASIKSKYNHHSFIYYLLMSMKRTFDVYNGEGTVFGCINKDTLNGISIVVPPVSVVKAFNDIVEELDCMILESHNENLRLIMLRDTLLPKLMSGEIKV